MARTLAPDLVRRLLALIAASIVLLVCRPLSQLIAIASGALLGLLVCRRTPAHHSAPINISISRRASFAAITLFVFLLFAPAVALALRPSQTLAVFQAFYSTGALVFGGGHVVLPLLQAATVAPVGSTHPPSSPGTAALRPSPGRSSPLPSTSERFSKRNPMVLPAPSSRSQPSSFPAFFSSWRSCPSGTVSVQIQPCGRFSLG